MTRYCLLILPAIFLAAGCSGDSAVPPVANAGKGSSAVSVGVPAVSATGSAQTSPSKGGNSAGLTETAVASVTSGANRASVPEMTNLFAPPKITVPEVTKDPDPEPQPQPQPEAWQVEQPGTEPEKKPLPQLRLVGFVEMEGLKALLSVEGTLNVLKAGDSTEGLEIVAIEPPAVTLRQVPDGDEFQLDLYDQPWYRQPGGAAPGQRPLGARPNIPPAPAPRRTPSIPPGSPFPAASRTAPPAAGLGALLSPPALAGPPTSGVTPVAKGLSGTGGTGSPSSPPPLPGVPGTSGVSSPTLAQ